MDAGQPSRKIEPILRRDHFRRRSGMYVGGVDQRALHRLCDIVLEGPVKLAHLHQCNTVRVTLEERNTVTIADNGPGIPVHFYRDSGRRFLELAVSEGEYDWESNILNTSWMLAGLSVVNALSERFVVEVARDGYLWRQQYSKGEPQTTVESVRALSASESTGTTITIQPDFTIFQIFQPNKVDYEWMYGRLRDLAYILPDATFHLIDERNTAQRGAVEFHYPNGIVDYVRYLNRNSEPLHAPLYAKRTFVPEPEADRPFRQRSPFDFEVALQYTTIESHTVLGFVGLYNLSDGSHLKGLQKGIRKGVARALSKKKPKQDVRTLRREDVMIGLTAVISIWHPDPQFESLYRINLLNPEVEWAVSDLVSDMIEEFAIEHPDQMRVIGDRFFEHRQKHAQQQTDKS